ncbi:hypothetical protein, partial [Klebsiella pneumoniae]|uniref:hypothetical protein n=1 Tax=Klebsiella pneumoniae TaxID=573 RepID=UPI0016027DDB
GSGFFGAFRWDDCGLHAVVQFFRKARFAQPDGLFVASLGKGVEFINGTAARKKLRLRGTEGDFSLLASFSVSVRHGFPCLPHRTENRNPFFKKNDTQI